ncbi:MAG TPA: BamA/TamA family outer membrane protein [Candidatus Binatia bacterium]
MTRRDLALVTTSRVHRVASWLLACALLACTWLAAAGTTHADERSTRTTYEVTATLETHHAKAVVRGSVSISFANASDTPLERVYLHLYPNRFRRDGDEVNDITRMHVYPHGAFHAGGIEVASVQDGSGAALQHPLAASQPDVPADTLLEVDLGAPLAPGERRTLVLSFTTYVPERYGPFGVTEYGVAAVAGWYPYLVARDANGAWRFTDGPEPADVSATVTAPANVTLVVGDQVYAPPHPATVQASARGVRTFALIALREARIVSGEANGTRITFVSPVPRRAQRLAPGPEIEDLLRLNVERAISLRPATLAAPAELVVVQVPLRWNLATPSDGIVVLSDRALRVQELLRGFHEAQVAQATYAELLRDATRGCPRQPPRWVTDGVAWQLADRYVRATQPDHRSVHDWIAWFDFFAIVDRFESAPKIPFVQSYFENARSDDELRENVFSYVGDRPPARLVLARLTRDAGSEQVQAAVDDWVAAPCEPFDTALASALQEDPAQADQLLASALAPPPPAEVPTIVEPSLRPRRERSTYQLVLDTADVEVSSTEFGLAALFVARRRYDYTKDIAINPYFTERSYGFNVGPRVHFGPRNDPNTYRHNVFLFYNYAWLDRGFTDDSEPELRTSGNVGGLGLRYDYSNVYYYDNPTEQREARLFVDWHDEALGGDYGFVRFGARVATTTPLFTPNTIGAIELLIGFEEETSSKGVPLQEQFSLGGRRALRGVSVNEKLARNIGLARFELRQDVYPEVDLNLLDLAVYRRPQLKLFVDTGQVDDSAGRALNPAHFAISAGAGINVLYDFLGFFPGRAYIELATRLDREQTDFQVLFGTRQAF